MTPLLLLSKFWFLILFMINTRFIFIGLGFMLGGVTTLEFEFIRDFMITLQELYHSVAASIYSEGQSFVPQFDDKTVEELAQEATQDYYSATGQ